ncbi:MAG: hydantoinase/oxoprolinase family protein [Chloroflexi bacterium]|nr:hydantoinase/oxoprolinase family protein [Chloroflexota bacterium]
MRIGVDIGGTFTDVVATNGAGDIAYVAKLPASAAAGSMLAGIDAALAATGSRPADVDVIVHATTLGTNALLQLSGTRVALVTTAGFRDVLELGRARRPALYDLHFEKLPPLVPRERRFEVRERVSHEGQVLVPLDAAGVAALAPALRAAEAEIVAVCLLHAYANPAHEQEVKRLLEAALPDVPVICSHEVLPEPKEFERTTTTVICAFLAPLIETYLGEVDRHLAERGLRAGLYVMHSAGGVLRPSDVRLRAHTLVESGPAAGVLAATQLIRTALPPAEQAGTYVAFDMGGTSAKACLIREGQFGVTTEYEVGRGAHESFSVRLSGYPIKSPVIDLIESGQGGGSIAWVDAAGVLKVGPQSAGAVPGPACYGRGGDLPTVTDCNLALGRLHPENFAGGTMALDADCAHRAIETHLAGQLGVDVRAAAAGVLRVVNAAMARSVRVISVQRGVDPRALALIAFGGAGPLHAAELADHLGMPRVLVPPAPGVFSAAGLVYSDLRMDFSHAAGLRCAPEHDAAVSALFATLAGRAADWLRAQRRDAGAASLALQADVRYVGQSHTLTVAADRASLGAGLAARIRQAFDAQHAALFSFANPTAAAEIVTCRVTCTVPLGGPPGQASSRIALSPPRASGGRAPRAAQRAVFFAGHGFVRTQILDRGALGVGEEIIGPAIIEEDTSTTVVPPGRQAVLRAQQVLELSVLR